MASLPHVYDVSAHPLLSATAAALVASDADAFQALTESAADLLGLSMVDWGCNETAALPRAANAIALQLNWMLDAAGASGSSAGAQLVSERRGPMSRTYRTGTDGGPLLVSPVARFQADAVRLAYATYHGVPSLRAGCGIPR